MKRCPKCGRSFADPGLNFCLNDGELLLQEAAGAQSSQNIPDRPYADDPPPTVMMNDPRATNPTGWVGPATPAQWQQTTPVYQAPYYPTQGFPVTQNQTLPIISLVLGILAGLLVCCYGGIWLGLPAAILGYMGMRNVEQDPARFGGRGLAIAGMILGIISFLISVVILILGLLGSISN